MRFPGGAGFGGPRPLAGICGSAAQQVERRPEGPGTWTACPSGRRRGCSLISALRMQSDAGFLLPPVLENPYRPDGGVQEP